MIEIILLATTDLHANLRAYDYYKDASAAHYGMSRVATLVAEERQKNPKALLVDAGDFMQGAPLGDVFGKGVPCFDQKKPHPVVDAFAFLRYDAVALGNHEFDFGLETLRCALKSATVPFTSANVRLAGSKPGSLVPMSTKALRTFEGVKVSTCFFGLTPPQILTWNKAKLAGRVEVDDGLSTARNIAKRLKDDGCDVVVAIVHGGIDPMPEAAQSGSENPAWHVAGIPEVDVVVAGHAHQEFPSPKFEGIKDGDLVRGTLRGKPVVMPGQWGAQLGVVTLRLERKNGRSRIVEGSARLRSTKDVIEDGAFVARVEKAHAATLLAMREPVAEIRQPIDTFMARLRSAAAVDLVNEAQIWFLASAVKGTPLAKLPLLSAAAPFKAGFKGEFTFIPAGPVLVKNVADLYVYPNTLQAVTLTGAQVKDWLEKSASAFNQVVPSDTGDRPLLDEAFPSYNFDVLSGVTYAIDVTRPVGSRIVELRYADAPLDPGAQFLVATNSYRAGGGGGFPHLGKSGVAFDAAKENREVLFDYLREKKIIDAKPAGGWRIKRVPGVKGRVWVDLSKDAAVPAAYRPWPHPLPVGIAPGFVRYVVDLAALE